MIGFLRSMLSVRRLLALLAILVLDALIIVFGPSLNIFGDNLLEPRWVRFTLAGTILLAWLAFRVGRYVQSQRANAKMLDALAEGGAVDDAQDARQRLEEVLEALRGGGDGRNARGRFVYRLPWFLFLGTPRADVAGLVQSSNLEMPFEAQLGRSGATGNVDGSRVRWWLTEEAVLVSTDAADPAAGGTWRGVLGFLRRYRPRRPIDGIILAVSVEELAGEAGRAAARTFNQLLIQAASLLGAGLQVYVVVTDADRLAGFAEFFASVDEGRREQALGVSLPVVVGAGHDQQPALEAALTRFVAGLGPQLPLRTEATRNLSERGLMTIWPEQMAWLADVAEAFIAEVMRTARSRYPIMLRGLFLTAQGGQKGAVDGWRPVFAGELGLSGVAGGQGRALGAAVGTGLLRDFIFKEAGLGGRSIAAERRVLALHVLGYLGVLALLVALLMPSWFEFKDRSKTLDSMDEAVRAESQLIAGLPPTRTLASVLPVLDQARFISRLGVKTIGARLFGFSSLNIKTAEAAAHQHYHRMLREYLLPMLAAEVANELRRVLNSGNSGLIHSLLRVYLMLGMPEHYQEADVKAWSDGYLGAAFPFDEAARHAASEHVAQLYRIMPEPVDLDMNLVSMARSALRQRPSAESIYGRLKDEAARSGMGSLDIVSALGPAGAQLLMLRTQAGLPVQVPALFTRDGFYQTFLPRLPVLVRSVSDDWVLGKEDALTPAEATAVTQQVTSAYVRDYTRQWQTVVEQIALPAMPDLPSLAGGLQTLAAADSPITALLQLIKQQTDLPMPAAPATLAGKAADAAASVVGKAVPGAAAAAQDVAADTTNPYAGMFADQATRTGWPGDLIARPFKPLTSLIDSQNGQAPILRVQNVLSSAYGVIAGIASGQNPQAAPDLLAKIISGQGADPLIGLRVQAVSLPVPLNSILRDLYQNSWSLLLQATLEKIETAWLHDVAPVCQQTIAQRYPFVDADQSANRDVTLQDFAAFFGPGGTMDKFVSDNLTLFMTTGPDGTLTPIVQNGMSLGISQQALAQINRARHFRDLFFGSDGNMLVKFWITPRYLDPRAISSVLSVGQTSAAYRHEPPRTTAFEWPGDDNGASSLTLTGADGLPVTVGGADGPWSLFRLIDEHGKVDKAGSQLVLSFGAGNMNVGYTLRTSSVVNPFVNRDFESFRCVPRL